MYLYTGFFRYICIYRIQQRAADARTSSQGIRQGLSSIPKGDRGREGERTHLMMSMMEASRSWRLTLEGAAAGTAHGGIVGAGLLHRTLMCRCRSLRCMMGVGMMMGCCGGMMMRMRMGMRRMGMAMRMGMMIGRRCRLQHFV